MTHAKKILVVVAIAAATAVGATAPALADGHAPEPPVNGHISVSPLGDGHTPTIPQD
jgi:hypothetical protein